MESIFFEIIVLIPKLFQTFQNFLIRARHPFLRLGLGFLILACHVFQQTFQVAGLHIFHARVVERDHRVNDIFLKLLNPHDVFFYGVLRDEPEYL